MPNSEEEEEEDTPQVAMYEDLSSPEEEEEEEPTPPSQSRHPLTHPSSKAPTKPLKSAKEIVLTESEEGESDSGVLQDEDFTPAPAGSTKKIKHQDLLDIFTGKAPPSPRETRKEKSSPKDEPHVRKPTKASTGLLIGDWGSPQAKDVRKGKEEGVERTKASGDSPDGGRERRREREKKRRSKKGKEEVATAENGLQQPTAAKREDPFGLTSSLDTWLNAGPEGSSSGLVSFTRYLSPGERGRE